MTNPGQGRTGTAARMAALLLLIAALSAAAPRADAQVPAAAAPEVKQQREIERALSAPRTRGLIIAPRPEPAVSDEPDEPDEPDKPAAPAVDTATAGAGSTVTDGAAQPLPAAASVALDIPFEINSSTLQPAAAMQLSQLAGALGSATLAGFRFLIAGHTDATGDAAYNRRLSGRRADAVRRRLIDAGVAAERLDARGFGEDEPLDPAHPNAAANRRVEIRNLGVAAH